MTEREALVQPGQRVGGVGERRPPRHGIAERLTVLGRGPHAVAIGDAVEDEAEHVGVAHRGVLGLDDGLVGGVEAEQLLAGGVDVVAGGPRCQLAEDARLPVDERAVTVEAQHPERLVLIHRPNIALIRRGPARAVRDP